MSVPSDKLWPSRTLEDQDMTTIPVVAGPPPFSSPDPTTDSRTMFDLTEGSNGGPSQEPQITEDMTEEEKAAAIQEAAGVAPAEPVASEEQLQSMTKAELVERAEGLGLDTSGLNKSELVAEIQEAELAQTQAE